MIGLLGRACSSCNKTQDGILFLPLPRTTSSIAHFVYRQGVTTPTPWSKILTNLADDSFKIRRARTAPLILYSTRTSPYKDKDLVPK